MKSTMAAKHYLLRTPHLLSPPLFIPTYPTPHRPPSFPTNPPIHLETTSLPTMIHSFIHRFPLMALGRRHPQMVKDGASSHTIDYIAQVQDVLNFTALLV